MRCCFRGFIYLVLACSATLATAQSGLVNPPQISLVSQKLSLFENRASSDFSPVLDLTALIWREREQLDSKSITLHQDKKSRFYMALLMALKNR